MIQERPAEISLRVPGRREYALVFRAALGGVAVLKDLSVDAMDDLRMAADEACDCLLHQGAPVEALELTVLDEGQSLTVRLEAVFGGEPDGSGMDADITRAVLETLIPRVTLDSVSGGIRRIELTLPKAV